MYRLAGILFEMRARDADAFVIAVGVLNKEFTVLDDRQLILTDLVALGQIGIELIFARKHGARCNRGVDR